MCEGETLSADSPIGDDWDRTRDVIRESEDSTEFNIP
jgi:hypothetical protein